ncbi:MAG TPA: DNA polymerase IV [Solirubrobacterales bacterium]|nr:DNA polymerase IV [Solirubrobacterales bacterium]
MSTDEYGTILHADADSFFASVEQRDDPRLRGRPVAVGGGVVMAASYEAKRLGVSGGMGGSRARQLCPDLVFVPPRFEAYVEASRDLFSVFEQTAPIVEGMSMEEAFLDVRGLERIAGPPPQIAKRLRREVRDRVGLAVSVGVARTKVLAKMASGAAKPDGLLVVRLGEEQAFLHPLPVERIWGVGRATAERLRAAGVDTVGDIARTPETSLVAIVGGHAGRRLLAIATNRDFRPVRSGRRRRSYGAQRALGLRRYRRGEVEPTLDALVDRVTRRMRAAHRVGRTVILRLRFGDYTRATRSATLPGATSESRPIKLAARGLIEANRALINRRGLTMVGITVTNVEPDGQGVQLRLPIGRPHAALDAALDELRERFGSGAVTRATNLDRNPQLAAKLLAGEAADVIPQER